MLPKHVDVQLHDRKWVTVAVLDLCNMIKSLLTDKYLMKPENLAEGVDIFTGIVTGDDSKYSEFHTGDLWRSAQKRFRKNGKDIPLGIVVFADKTHTDHNSALVTTQVIFTLTIFNQKARNRVEFWRPLGYIPNLAHGKGSVDKTDSFNKVQDEHTCLAAVIKQMIRLSTKGGMDLNVLGRDVVVQPFIYVFIGDAQGNNTLLGHYNGSGELKRPYRDCKYKYCR